MAETPRGTIGAGAVEVSAARLGRSELGAGAVSVDDDAFTLVARTAEGDRVLRVPLSAIDSLDVSGDELAVLVRDGRQIIITTGEGARLRDDLCARCFTLPELTRALRAFGSRRRQRGTRATAAAEQQRFFAPFVDARRAASKTASPPDAIAAFDSAALVRAVDEALRRLVGERFGESGPARRALEAELADSCEPLYDALRVMGERAAEARARAGDLRAWRAWSLSLRDLFEAADRAWLLLDAALDLASRIPTRAT